MDMMKTHFLNNGIDIPVSEFGVLDYNLWRKRGCRFNE